MSQPIIQVRDLSKVYQLGSIGALSLKDEFSRFWAKLRGGKKVEGRGRPASDGNPSDSPSALPDDKRPTIELPHNSPDEFWALRDVSFDVQRGEVLGVIGRNGAGKSTLLKILSRITQQTTGEITLRGRVASLLEVGTGFHPDLTGRENIFLNGAILGMTKAEIRSKFDEIVAFSEIDNFIDTPVKRYSSGMYVRLAFAVAAHLEPEILIVDEVLAVGDAQFQEKCIGKMQNVSRGGRTVLFVSHNMNAVTKLCSKAVVLKQGKVAYTGDVRNALAHYGSSTQVAGRITLAETAPNSVLKSVEILQNDRPTGGILEPTGRVTFSFSAVAPHPLRKPRLAVAFANSAGIRLFVVASWLGPDALPSIEGHRTIRIGFDMPPLVPGRYTLDMAFYNFDSKIIEHYESAGAIEVSEANYLKMTEPDFPEIGQFYVRSQCTVS